MLWPLCSCQCWSCRSRGACPQPLGSCIQWLTRHWLDKQVLLSHWFLQGYPTKVKWYSCRKNWKDIKLSLQLADWWLKEGDYLYWERHFTLQLWFSLPGNVFVNARCQAFTSGMVTLVGCPSSHLGFKSWTPLLTVILTVLVPAGSGGCPLSLARTVNSNMLLSARFSKLLFT